MSEELSTVHASPGALVPSSFQDVAVISGWIANSGLGGPAWRKEGTAALAVMKVMNLGLPPSMATELYVMKGGDGALKFTYPASMLVAACLNRGECLYFRCTDSTETSCTWETHRDGSPKPESYTFTMKDAQKAGIAKNNVWLKWPKDMLSARASAKLARRVYPDLLAGCYTREELVETEQYAPVREEDVQLIEEIKTPPLLEEAPPLPSSPTLSEAEKEKVELLLRDLDDCKTLDALLFFGKTVMKEQPDRVKDVLREPFLKKQKALEKKKSEEKKK